MRAPLGFPFDQRCRLVIEDNAGHLVVRHGRPQAAQLGQRFADGTECSEVGFWLVEFDRPVGPGWIPWARLRAVLEPPRRPGVVAVGGGVRLRAR